MSISNELASTMIERIFAAATSALPAYLANPLDFSGSQGNVSMCIIDAGGRVYGRMWGTNKITSRDTFKVAWHKANQVWISGYPTVKYEELVYSGQVDPGACGLMHPELIGWEGGWPVLVDGALLAIAVSGMRGEKDTALALGAVAAVGGTVKPI